MTEDTELLRRYVEEGSQEAFAELVERRIGLVYSVGLRRTSDPVRAEEIAQEVFTDLARKAASLSRHATVVGWLHRSAYYAAAIHVRAERNRIARETEAYNMGKIFADDAPQADWDELRPVLDEVLNELNERDREAVLLRYFDNRPFGDIGSQLRLSENAARMRVERALDKLHALLARRGIKSTSTAVGLLVAQQATAATAPVGLAATTSAAALASANAAATSVLAGALQFMAATKTSVAVTSLVLIGSAGLLLNESKASRSLDAEIAAAQRQQEPLNIKLATLRTRVNDAEASAARARAAADAAKADRADELKKAQDDMTARLTLGTAWLARHPEIKELVVRELKTRRATEYERLFKVLALTPAQIDRFLDLICRASGGILTTPDNQPLMYDLGGDPKTTKEELRSLLGEEGFKRYQAYASEMSGLQTVTQLGGMLAATAEPLSPSQGERLLTLLSENKTVKMWNGRNHYDWEEIFRGAQTFLSEQQLEFLNDLRAQDEFSQSLTRSRNPNL
ncbi:MAG: sigma-70 family RNA polymerase sigma factor [Nibricoccus sp.]